MENQRTICDWALETFGACSTDTALERCMEEFNELVQAIWRFRECGKDVGLECADVLITLYRVAEMHGQDLHKLVDEKMKVNRARKWKVTAAGVGQHE